ncbi:MAG: hypothetical protein ACPGID_04770 [Rubricella sp.]
MEFLVWIIAIFGPVIAFAIEGARRSAPDARDMDPQSPLSEAAAKFVAGLALSALAILAVMRFGLLMPAAAAIAVLFIGRALAAGGTLKPLYRHQLPLAIAGILATATLWLTTTGQ